MTTNDRRPLVIGLGEVLWDLLPEGKQLGGAPANFAYHATQLGARGIVVSAVGDDPAGKEIRQRLSAAGLDVSFLAVDPAHPTGTVDVALDPAGKPTFTIHEGVAWDFIPASPDLLGLASRADAVCFGTLAQRSPVSRATLRAFLGGVRPDCLRVFDINLRQHFYSRDVIEPSLRASTVLKLNDDELPAIADLLGVAGHGCVMHGPCSWRAEARPPASVEERARTVPFRNGGSPGLRRPEAQGPCMTQPYVAGADDTALLRAFRARYGLDLVAVTRGAKGCTLLTPSERVDHPGFRPDRVADTVGAGDSFTAALAMGLLARRPLAEIGESANRLAAYVCSQPGAMPPHPATRI